MLYDGKLEVLPEVQPVPVVEQVEPLVPYQRLILNGIKKIRKYGWTTHRYGNEEDGYCMLGSIGFHAFQDGIFLPVVSEAAMRMAQVVGSPVSDYNDAPCRNKEEVISAMLRAVNLTEKQRKLLGEI